jgi:hypothetical protein
VNRYLRFFPFVVVVAAFLGVGVTLIAKSVDKLRANFVVDDWPAAEGRIVVSESFLDAGVKKPRIVYSYEVAGKIHRSSRINVAPLDESGDVDSMLTKYPAGTVVTVRYKPDDPATAVLQAGDDSAPYRNLSWGAVLFVAGLILLLKLRRRWRSGAASNLLRKP